MSRVHILRDRRATSLQMQALLVLWASGLFDTLDLALLLGLAESEVCRLLQIARDLQRGAP